ncbi:glycosyltransferase family 4 protein [Anthocerotibacter panamensis]|uniref:glycosyltransferase family 4 protein n=1 Tax=Anthocerotibacter panamensis TaxID=2857077 RepID=UPI001FDA16E4|nr:glycosyltransferase family 1 protein [Anthocerotibacter panamensis]
MTTPLLVNLSSLSTRVTGLTAYARNLLPHLQALHPTLLTAQELPGYTCQRIPAGLGADSARSGHIRRLLWTQTALPTLARNHLIFSPVPEAPLFARCRYVVTLHDCIPLRFPRLSPLTPYFRFYIPQVLAQAEHILCDSQATASDITQFYKVSADRITIVLLAHDAEHFRPQGLPTGNYFLALSRHDPHKNLDRLISAFACLEGDSELWIAGPPVPSHTPKLQALVAEKKLSRRVRFLEYVPYAELPGLIERSLALVFPSLWEGFGLPVLEAMACGAPVITSKLSSLPEVAGEAALLIDPYNTSELAGAMEAILRTPGLRSRLQEAGLRRARRFSWEKTGAQTVALLRQYC